MVLVVHRRPCRHYQTASIWPVEQRVKMLAILCGTFSVKQNSGLGAKVLWCPFDYSQNQCPAEYNVRSIRVLSAPKPSSTPTCSRTHHHPQQPPRYPRGKGRWSRRVVSRSSPELKSGASRPSLSIRCTGKRVVSRALTYEHRRELARRRETITRRTHGGPICQVAGATARCDMLRSSTRSRACLALWFSCQGCARIAA